VILHCTDHHHDSLSLLSIQSQRQTLKLVSSLRPKLNREQDFHSLKEKVTSRVRSLALGTQSLGPVG
jgi:hypothetical protein